jgi:hypothetical protein
MIEGMARVLPRNQSAFLKAPGNYGPNSSAFLDDGRMAFLPEIAKKICRERGGRFLSGIKD